MSQPSAYELKSTLLLALGFGLVALDRWLVVPLWPTMAQDLHLNYQDQGNVVGALSPAWGVCAMAFGRVSDGIGRRRVLIPAVVFFSALCGITSLVASLGMLIVFRILMGAAEGAYTPVSVAAVAEASAPQRRGLNQGIMLGAFPLLGLGLGPIIATQLLSVVPSWRWVFLVVALSGLPVAWLLAQQIREPKHLDSDKAPAVEPIRWREALGSRNVVVAMVAACLCMIGVFTLSAMISSYLTVALHLTLVQMGFVTSAIGFGGFFGSFVLAGASDYFGRRRTAVISFVAAFVSLFIFSKIGPDLRALFGLLFCCAFFCFGVLGLLTGPVPTEAVSPALTASAVGLVSGIAEIFGGSMGPSLGGYVAQHDGIASILNVALAGLAAGAVTSVCLRETAPRLTKPPISTELIDSWIFRER